MVDFNMDYDAATSSPAMTDDVLQFIDKEAMLT